MKGRKLTYRIIAVAILALINSANAYSQSENDVISKVTTDIENITDSLITDSIISDSTYTKTPAKRSFLKNLGGFSVAADVFGAIEMVVSDYGQIEGALKIDIKGTYYPTLEAGLGKCDLTDDNTGTSYKTTAPFFRIGLDYNMLTNKLQRNKLFVGARYGFSSFKYDISGPAMQDPIFGGEAPFSYSDQSSNCHWIEFLLGVQVQIWNGFHMGWSVRYKSYIKLDESIYTKPYYIPGYGTTTNKSCWGATYTLMWDVKL